MCECDDIEDDCSHAPRHRYIKSYSHLTQKQKDYVCRRYGHRFKVGDKDKHCERCGIRVDLSAEDILIRHFERRALERFKNAAIAFNRVRDLPQIGPQKIVFNAWTRKN